jgi:hypothetical protein
MGQVKAQATVDQSIRGPAIAARCEDQADGGGKDQQVALDGEVAHQPAKADRHAHALVTGRAEIRFAVG